MDSKYDLRVLAAKLERVDRIDPLEQRVAQLELMMLELTAGVSEPGDPIREAEVLTLPEPTAPARPEWVRIAHETLIEWATKRTRLGVPRRNTLFDGRYVYIHLHPSALASIKRINRPWHEMVALRLPENAHPLITWMRGPRGDYRRHGGGADSNRTLWVRVETGATGVAMKAITPAEAAEMFYERGDNDAADEHR